jgi:hypothetical protein
MVHRYEANEVNDQSAIAYLSISISMIALGISFVSLWFSHIKQGQILMTRPTIFFFGWDEKNGTMNPKIFIRCLLFSTANSGRVLENLFLVVNGPIPTTIFSFWGHTMTESNSLVRGSGLFVSPHGHSANHHFNPHPGTQFNNEFVEGNYEIEVVGRQFGDTADRKLGRYVLEVSAESAKSLRAKNGVLWTLDPQSRNYFPEVSTRK